MASHGTQVPFEIKLTIHDDSTPEPIFYSVPMEMYVAIFRSILKIGFLQTFAVATAGMFALNPAQGPTEQQSNEIGRFLLCVEAHAKQFGPTDENYAIVASYFLLQLKVVTRAEAADFASDLLQKPVSSEAWRKRVDRWATQNSYPTLTQHLSK